MEHNSLGIIIFIIGYRGQTHREDNTKEHVQERGFTIETMSNKWLQSSQVKVSLVHDCSKMSKSYHGEIKITERIHVPKAMLARCINFL